MKKTLRWLTTVSLRGSPPTSKTSKWRTKMGTTIKATPLKMDLNQVTQKVRQLAMKKRKKRLLEKAILPQQQLQPLPQMGPPLDRGAAKSLRLSLSLPSSPPRSSVRPRKPRRARRPPQKRR